MKRIAVYLAQDMSINDIADELGYTYETVKRLASSPLMKAAVERLVTEGALGVDFFIEATTHLDFYEAIDESDRAKRSSDAWEDYDEGS